MYSKLLKIVKENKDWLNIMEQKKIKVKFQDNLALFKYDIMADFHDEIVREARGIIIDLDEMKVISRPFDKFGNYGESYVEELDWASARVQEKMDGSLMKIWFYNDSWYISTNGTIDAFSVKNNEEYNFGKMFLKAIEEQKPDLLVCGGILNPEYTYMFELIGPQNQIVVKYDKLEIYHIGTRHNLTGEEIDVDIGIQKPKEYNLHSLEDCIEFAKTFKAQEHEGFVVVDGQWRRVKIKSPEYIIAHGLVNNSVLTTKKALDLIFQGDMGEYLTYFPEKKEVFDKVMAEMAAEEQRIRDYIALVDSQHFETRKDFAVSAYQHKYFPFVMSVLFDHKELDIPKKYWVKFFKAE